MVLNLTLQIRLSYFPVAKNKVMISEVCADETEPEKKQVCLSYLDSEGKRVCLNDHLVQKQFACPTDPQQYSVVQNFIDGFRWKR